MNFTSLLKEVKLSTYRNTFKKSSPTGKWDKNRYYNKFINASKSLKSYGAFLSKNKYRLYIPFNVGDTGKSIIIDFLLKHNYQVDWESRTATLDGKRFIKIGKILNKLRDKKIQDIFNKTVDSDNTQYLDEDPSVKYVCISRHPLDIINMSANDGNNIRPWAVNGSGRQNSCMSTPNGMFCEYVPKDVKQGTIIAYEIDSDDLNIHNPSGRILIKPFINSEDDRDIILYPPNRVYGSMSREARSLIYKFIDIANSSSVKNLGSYYENHPDLYDDMVNGSEDYKGASIGGSPQWTPEQAYDSFIEGYTDNSEFPIITDYDDYNRTFDCVDFTRQRKIDVIYEIISNTDDFGEVDIDNLFLEFFLGELKSDKKALLEVINDVTRHHGDVLEIIFLAIDIAIHYLHEKNFNSGIIEKILNDILEEETLINVLENYEDEILFNTLDLYIMSDTIQYDNNNVLYFNLKDSQTPELFGTIFDINSKKITIKLIYYFLGNISGNRDWDILENAAMKYSNVLPTLILVYNDSHYKSGISEFFLGFWRDELSHNISLQKKIQSYLYKHKDGKEFSLTLYNILKNDNPTEITSDLRYFLEKCHDKSQKSFKFFFEHISI